MQHEVSGEKKQWIDDIVQWEEKPGRSGKTGGEQKGLSVLSSWSRLRSYIGHGKLMMMV